MNTLDKVTAWKEAFLKVSEIKKFQVAVVCGSGLSHLATSLGGQEIDFDEIGLPGPSVSGHGGKIVAAEINGKGVLVFTGRVHLYENRGVNATVANVQLAASLGVKEIILTNATGGLVPDWGVGVPMLITDHINMTGDNALRGAELEGIGRFIDCSSVYSKRIQSIAEKIDGDVRRGVLVSLAGPTYETPAEIKMVTGWGASAVGMSVVNEAIVANALGLEVLGISLITNLAAGLGGKLSHEEVKEAGLAAGPRMEKLVIGTLKELTA